MVAISDVNGNVVEKYSYDVFGEPTIRDANGFVKEIPRLAKGGNYIHIYYPITVLERKQLVLLESIVVYGIHSFAPPRIVSTRL